MDPHMHNPQNTSDPELRRETRENRQISSTNGARKRSRSSSTPPDSRLIHDNNMRQRTGFSPISVGQSLITVGRPPSTQSTVKRDPRPRRNSVSHPPAPTHGQMSISSPADRPVIPGVTTDVAHVPNRLRKVSYQRPSILFYHRHEPHYGFTNFSDHPVVYQDKKYPTSEHLFQSLKVCGILHRAFGLII